MTGGADQLQPPGADVGDAADVVPDLLGRRIEVERVDREIAARRVLGLRAVDVVGEQPAVLVGRVVAGLRGAERRHLDGLRPECTWTRRKRRPMMNARRNSGFTCSGVRVGGDVEILGLDAEQQVAHRAADDEGLEAGLLQLAA